MNKTPLQDIFVIDFGQYIAAPLVASNLADQGANVLHIDPPEGPRINNEMTEMLNRKKKNIKLNLKDELDVTYIKNIILTADIIIDGFHPKTLLKLGIDLNELYSKNKKLIILTLPGYASTDIDKQNIKAWEGIILADYGIFSDMGLNRTLMGIKTSYSPLPLASVYGAIIGTLAIYSALYTREIHGFGDIIEVPLASALLDCLVYNSLDISNIHERYKCIRERVIENRIKMNKPMNFTYTQLDKLLDPFYRTYFCADGRSIYIVAPCNLQHQVKTLKILDIYEEIIYNNLSSDDTYKSSDKWQNNTKCILGTYPITSYYWNNRLTKMMSEIFKTKISFEWEKIFGFAKIPLTVIRSTREWINSEHANISEMIISQNTSKGPMKQIGKNIWLHKDYEDNSIILKKNKKKYIEHPKMTYMKGIKILDLSNVIAGPTISSVLSRFGATVIKIDPVKPTFDPLVTVLMGIPANRGKKSMLLDIKKIGADTIFNKLISWADIVNVNQTEDQLKYLGIDMNKFRDINSNIIIMHFDAYGGPSIIKGPMSNFIGYDDLLQAATGIMERFGGSLDTPEEHAHLGTIDVVSGFQGASVCALALYYREKTGNGIIARTSLATATLQLQIPFLYDYSHRDPFNEPKGRHVVGEHTLYRWYKCKDTYIFIACKGTEKDILKLRNIYFLKDIINSYLDYTSEDLINSIDLSNELQKIFYNLNSDIVINEFIKNNLSAIKQGFLLNNRINNTILSNSNKYFNIPNSSIQWIKYNNHPIGNPVTIFSPCSIRSKYSSIINQSMQPKYGKNTYEILKELNFKDNDIEQFYLKKIIGYSWSDEYCPEGNPWKSQDFNNNCTISKL